MKKSIRAGLAAIAVGGALAGSALVSAPAQAAGCDGSANSLKFVCSQAQFDNLFRNASPTPLPVNAVMNGGVRPMGGPNPGATDAAGFWQGKHFYRGWLNNRVFGGEALPADVFSARSSIDRKPAVRIDYRRSGLPNFHDELRRLPNGVYLGYGFAGDTAMVSFWVWR